MGLQKGRVSLNKKYGVFLRRLLLILDVHSLFVMAYIAEIHCSIPYNFLSNHNFSTKICCFYSISYQFRIIIIKSGIQIV